MNALDHNSKDIPGYPMEPLPEPNDLIFDIHHQRMTLGMT